jgi:hypothetical protein
MKLHLNFSHLNFNFFQTTSDEETIKVKFVYLKMLFNFIVDNLFLFEIMYPRKIIFQFSYIWIFKQPRMEKWPK